MSQKRQDLDAIIKGGLAKLEAIRQARDSLTDVAVEREAGLPQGWIAKTRLGKNRHPSAMASVGLFMQWIAANETRAPRRRREPGEPPAEDRRTNFGALADEIREIGTSAKRHRQALQNLAIALIEDPEFDAKRAELMLNTLKAMKESIKLEKIEAAQEKLAEILPMPEDEFEAFAAWRAASTPKGLAPGEAAKPPGAAL
jgi:hypothetical protein